MGTTLHSFIDIFDTAFETGQEPVQLKKISVPIIQRDYAQGRLDPSVRRVRRRFLESLYNAVTGQPITLDFVYGDVDTNGVMTPLDGQQRLTTLFLLHWYAAKRGNIAAEEYAFLRNFSYETRYSARYFCTELVAYDPSFAGRISDEIVDQAWFPLEWKKDPTVSSMLVMLDDIDEKFKDIPDLWDRLKSNAITFYFLPIKDMGLTDELYIKMNSRGKPLTQFEHFKADLEREIQKLDENLAKQIIQKIDLDWTDMLWRYRDSGAGTNDDLITDDEFLRYFKFICDIICYREGRSPQGQSMDDFDLLQRYFSQANENALTNVKTMEAYFDCWCDMGDYQDPASFLAAFMTREHEPGKILVDNRYKIDIFEDCLHSYSDKNGQHRQFTLGRIVLLYAFTTFLLNRESVSEAEFARRLRIINNLIQNSEDEIVDRAERNRIPAILKQVDAIVLTGQIDDSIDNNFNVNQLQEEKDKIAWIDGHPDQAEMLYALEDHPRLYGQIAVLGLENVSYQPRFESLFGCSLDRIDCALMAIGDYGQIERNGWRRQYGSSGMIAAWNSLFHKSANSRFENIKNVLCELLSKAETFTNDSLKEISDAFLRECEEKQVFPWRYYYVKYDQCRPGSFGKYSFTVTNAPYFFSVMQTRQHWSQNTYILYFKIADEAHLSRDDCGQRLVFEDDTHMICENAAFVLRQNSTEEELKRIVIPQNEEGLDTENRILILKRYLDSKGN